MSDKKSSTPFSRASSGEPSRDSREALLVAAKRVFALRGYEGATVKDLSDAAQVNSSLVSYHFGGKEGLYRSCLESFGMERVEAAERILNAPKNREEFTLRLKLFAEEWIRIHSRDGDTCKMIYRGMETLDAISAAVFKEVFYRIFVSLNRFLSAAQIAGFLRTELDMEMTAVLMFGSLMHLLRGQDIARLLGKPTLENAAYRELAIDHWTSCFADGIFKVPPRESLK